MSADGLAYTFRIMIKLLTAPIFLLGVLAAMPSQAQETLRQARVLSSTPIIGSVPYVREVCQNVRVYKEGNTSGFGAITGGILGAVVGNQFGKGNGRAAMTAAGAVGGGIWGNSVEKPGPGSYATEYQCGPQTTTEMRTLGFQVVYEIDGNQYSTRLDRDPGPSMLIR